MGRYGAAIHYRSPVEGLGIGDVADIVVRNIQNLFSLIGTNIQCCQKALCRFCRIIPGNTAYLRATHGDTAMEQATRRGHAQQSADLAAATGLSEHSHIARVATETFDVVANPFQRSNDIEHAHIARLFELAVCDTCQIQIAPDIHSMIHANHDNIMLVGKIRPVVATMPCGSSAKTAAVQPYHDGTLATVTQPGSPHVKAKAIFTCRFAPIHDNEFSLRRGLGDRTTGAKFERIAHTRPAGMRSRRLKAPCSSRSCCVRHTFE